MNMMQGIHCMMMTYMVPRMMMAIVVMMIIGFKNQGIIQMPGVMMVMMVVVIDRRVIWYPLMAMIIMRIHPMVINIMMVPETRIMMMVGTIPIFALGMIRGSYQVIQCCLHISKPGCHSARSGEIARCYRFA
jgi:hypothetical protein